MSMLTFTAASAEIDDEESLRTTVQPSCNLLEH